MGLDMWICRKDSEFDYDSGIECDDDKVIWWRNAHMIHNYMNKLFEGVQNYEEYTITLDELKDLRNRCQEVFDNHSLAEELLPDPLKYYDKTYFIVIKNTIININNLIEQDNNDEYYYRAWW